jgi:hypothetical protein
MGKNKDKRRDGGRREGETGKGKKLKDKCCEKYKKKGRHCKDCPLAIIHRRKQAGRGIERAPVTG